MPNRKLELASKLSAGFILSSQGFYTNWCRYDIQNRLISSSFKCIRIKQNGILFLYCPLNLNMYVHYSICLDDYFKSKQGMEGLREREVYRY